MIYPHWIKAVLTLISACLLIISVLVPPLSFLIWIALVPFFLAIRSVSRFKSFLIGLLIGTAYFSSLFYWIIYYELRIFLLVLVFEIPFFGFFALLTRWLSEKFSNPFQRVWMPPLIWQMMTCVYSLTPVEDLGQLDRAFGEAT